MRQLSAVSEWRFDLKILVLAGGLSPERNVSLSSGALITAALRRKGHNVCLQDVYMDAPVTCDDTELFKKEGSLPKTDTTVTPDLEALKHSCGDRPSLIGDGVLELCRRADSVFLALHGAMGENGQLQATLDVHGIHYTGSGYIGSLLAMDKDISKKMFVSAGVLTPPWLKIDTQSPPTSRDVIDAVGLPAVIKPCSCGSSVGVSIVNTEEEMTEAIAAAAKFERYILAETKIDGRELTSAYLDGDVLPPVEIIPKSGFYDYKNKYQAGATEEICPPSLPDGVTSDLENTTKRGFKALRLHGYARFDYILDRENKLWCLEANTLPGMTPTSLLPMEAAAVGISYDELCEKLALLALDETK